MTTAPHGRISSDRDGRESAEDFNAAANLRQNLEFYAAERARKEKKRAIHNAILEVQGKTLVQQRQWLEEHKGQLDTAVHGAVVRYLHPRLQLELIRETEEEIIRQAASIEKPSRRKRLDAENFLRHILQSGRGVPAATILREAKASGFHTRTVYRAKATLYVRTRRVGFGRGGHFEWFLPRDPI